MRKKKSLAEVQQHTATVFFFVLFQNLGVSVLIFSPLKINGNIYIENDSNQTSCNDL